MSLWSIKELASFLGYKESTVARLVTQAPDKLPPRVLALSRPRWEQSVVEDWAIEQSFRKPATVQRLGRPRNAV